MIGTEDHTGTRIAKRLHYLDPPLGRLPPWTLHPVDGQRIAVQDGNGDTVDSILWQWSSNFFFRTSRRIVGTVTAPRTREKGHLYTSGKVTLYIILEDLEK